MSNCHSFELDTSSISVFLLSVRTRLITRQKRHLAGCSTVHTTPAAHVISCTAKTHESNSRVRVRTRLDSRARCLLPTRLVTVSVCSEGVPNSNLCPSSAAHQRYRAQRKLQDLSRFDSSFLLKRMRSNNSSQPIIVAHQTLIAL